jgi:PKD repeat protein
MDASDSSDPDGRVRQYHFDYGDGTDSGWVFSATINHTYSEQGTYEVRVYVRDEADAQSLEPAVVEVVVANEDEGNGGDGNGIPTLPAWAAITAIGLVTVLTILLGMRRYTGGR